MFSVTPLCLLTSRESKRILSFPQLLDLNSKVLIPCSKGQLLVGENTNCQVFIHHSHGKSTVHFLYRYSAFSAKFKSKCLCYFSPWKEADWEESCWQNGCNGVLQEWSWQASHKSSKRRDCVNPKWNKLDTGPILYGPYLTTQQLSGLRTEYWWPRTVGRQEWGKRPLFHGTSFHLGWESSGNLG